MNDLSKKLYVLPNTSEIIWKIINETHTVDFQPQGMTKTGKPKKVIPKVKNLKLMYPKYIYIIHTLTREARNKLSDYHLTKGYGLSASVLKKRICEDGPMVSLILNKLKEHGIILKTRKHSTFRKGSASKFKLTPEYEEKVWQATQETFARSEYGKMIEILINVDEEYDAANKKINQQLYGKESTGASIQQPPNMVPDDEKISGHGSENNTITTTLIIIPLQQEEPITNGNQPIIETSSTDSGALTREQAFEKLDAWTKDSEQDGRMTKGYETIDIRRNIILSMNDYPSTKPWKDELLPYLDDYIYQNLLMKKTDRKMSEIAWEIRTHAKVQQQETSMSEYSDFFIMIWTLKRKCNKGCCY